MPVTRIHAFGRFDETQYSADPKDPDDSEEGRRHRKVLHDVFHDDADDGSYHQDEVEHIPASSEVLEPQPNYFDHTFCNQRKRLLHLVDS